MRKIKGTKRAEYLLSYTPTSLIFLCVGARRKKKKSPFDPIISASPRFIRRMMYIRGKDIKRRKKREKMDIGEREKEKYLA
jgi:hypothetical protein